MNRLSLNINSFSEILISLFVGVISVQLLGKSSDKIKLISDKKEDLSILKRVESLNTYLKEDSYSPPLYPHIENLPQEFIQVFPEQIPAPDIEVKSTISSRDVDFDLRAASHLLRRTTFGPTWEQINMAHDEGLDATVDALLEEQPTPDPPGDWIDDPTPPYDSLTPEQLDSLNQAYRDQRAELRSWIIDNMLEEETSIHETMTLFWHDHFATSALKVSFPPALYNYYALLRQHSLGNIKDFVKAMAVDPAMLIWLDNKNNRYRHLYVTGDSDEWSGYGRKLTDEDEDGVYDKTIALSPGLYRYLYTCGGFSVYEDVPDECAYIDPNDDTPLHAFGINNEDIILDPHPWGGCSEEGYNNGPMVVNFNVDMTGVDLQGGAVHVTGTMDDWSGFGLTLMPEGDGIYSGSMELEPGVYEYLYTITGEFDDWSGWGMVGNPPLGSNCDWNPDDEWANFGFALVNTDTVTLNNIWSECLVDDSYFHHVTFQVSENPCPLAGINENFSRELLELFTIGVGNYSQEDIVEAARAYTGYTTDGLETFFIENRHDFGPKTFMGQTGYWFGDDIVDIIFEQEETARFFARKIFQWFVYYNPDEAAVEEMADILRENDYEVKPMLEALFKSELFFDENFRGAKYGGGIVHVLSPIRQMYVTDIIPPEGQTRNRILLMFQEYFGQALLYPPDVSGWLGYRNWINTYTLPYRKLFTNAVIDGYVYDFPMGFQVDVLEFASHFSNPNDAEQLIDDMILYFYDIQPTEHTRQLLLDQLLQGLDPYNWALTIPEAEDRLKGTIKLLMRYPDFQLK